MHPLFKRRSSHNSTLRPVSLRIVFWSCFAWCFPPFFGEEAHREEENLTLCSLIGNGSVAALDKCKIGEDIALLMSTTRPLQDYLKEEGARVWVVKRRSLLDVSLEWIAALLSLNAAYNDKLWMPRFRGCFSLTEKHCAQQCGHNEFEPATPDWCPGFFMITTAEEEPSLFSCPGS